MRMENVEDIYELSPLQQGMLFHTVTTPDSSVYVEQLTCTLAGDLNLYAFERAWHRILQRHGVLRSAFHWEDLDKPYQVVFRHVDLPWNELDWQHLRAAEQQDRLSFFLESERRRKIDLAEPPLMRFSIIRLGNNCIQL